MLRLDISKFHCSLAVSYTHLKSIERRKKQGLKIDSTDLPVCKKYVDAIRRKRVHILVTGKWENFVTVSCNDSVLIDEIARLPFVRSAEKVWKGKMEKATRRDSLINKPLRTCLLYTSQGNGDYP